MDSVLGIRLVFILTCLRLLPKTVLISVILSYISRESVYRLTLKRLNARLKRGPNSLRPVPLS